MQIEVKIPLPTVTALKQISYRAGRVGERVTKQRDPLSPRRTGGEDFRRPGLLKTLASGMRTTRQADQPQAHQVLVPRLSSRRTVRPLTAALQMLDQTALNIAVDLTVNAPGVPDGKIVRPPFQVPIQLSNQGWDRLETLMTVGHFVQFLPLSLDRLLRRIHIQVFACASFQIAVVPKRVSQKVQTRSLFPQIHHSRLFPVDLQLELSFQPRLVDLREEGASLNFLGYTFRYDRNLKGRARKYLNMYPSKQA